MLCIGAVKVFAEMEKDAVLSCLTDTEVGKLSGEFYVRLLSLRSAEVLSLNEDDVLLSEAQFRVRGRMMLDQSRQRVEGCPFVFHRYG